MTSLPATTTSSSTDQRMHPTAALVTDTTTSITEDRHPTAALSTTGDPVVDEMRRMLVATGDPKGAARQIQAAIQNDKAKRINVAFEIEEMPDGDGSGQTYTVVTTPTHPCDAVTIDQARALFEVERRKFSAAEDLIDKLDPAFQEELDRKVAEIIARPKVDHVRSGGFVHNVALAGMKHVKRSEQHAVGEAQRRALVVAHADARGTTHLAEVHAMAVWAIQETLRMAKDPDGLAANLTSAIARGSK